MKENGQQLCLWLVSLALLVQPAFAASDVLRGTWSGRWAPDSSQRPVTVRFVHEGDEITGEMLNPEQLHFDSVTFDTETSSVVSEVTSSERGHSKLEVRTEEDTRVNGTLTHDDETADVRLTKWKYRR